MHTTIPEPFPQTKPATEFIRGRLVRKMTPGGRHGRVEVTFGRYLLEWADQRGWGRVAAEWDYDVATSEGVHRLVPDVACLSSERVPFDDDRAAEIPKVAPGVAIEVLSQGQTMAELRDKASLFLEAGSELVILVDPKNERVELRDPWAVTTLHRDAMLVHPALPGFELPLPRLFAKPGEHCQP